VRSAFGKEYKTSAIAHLESTSFDIVFASPEEQSLDQPRVDWKWNIKPIDPGQQSLDGYIEIECKTVNRAGTSEKCQIWSYHLEIEVVQPIVSSGQVSTLSLVSSFVGSGLSVPWLYEIYNKRKMQRRKSKKRI
jgi:hypothetical protein